MSSNIIQFEFGRSPKANKTCRLFGVSLSATGLLWIIQIVLKNRCWKKWTHSLWICFFFVAAAVVYSGQWHLPAQGSWELKVNLCGVSNLCGGSLCVYVGSLSCELVLWFFCTSKKHAGYSKLPLCLNKCVNVCMNCALSWFHSRFPACTQCLWIHHDQNEAVIKK